MGYVLGIDQSTQGTKMLLFDERGVIVERVDKPHRQIVDKQGYVSHDMKEVYRNVLDLFQSIIRIAGIVPREIKAIGISNQRETTVAWDENGKPYAPAIVWQCSRATEIATRIAKGKGAAEQVSETTGIPLSPFFPAAKMRWLLEHDCKNVPVEQLHMGTVDSYLVYRLTNGAVFATDASNASRTQLMDIDTRTWSASMCELFDIPMSCLPEIKDSNALYGETDFWRIVGCENPNPLCDGGFPRGTFRTALHACRDDEGDLRHRFLRDVKHRRQAGKSSHGLATSLAWSIDGKADYVLEGNINYTGAVISWLKDDLGLIASAGEVNGLCDAANPADTAVVVPAFTGLSAPYWANDAKAAIVGMTRTTRKAEIVRAATESIAQQITDVYEAMKLDFGSDIDVLRADGGPTKNPYLMQFQSDMTGAGVCVSAAAELSAIGVAYMAGIAAGIYDKIEVFKNLIYQEYSPKMDGMAKEAKRDAWKAAVSTVLGNRRNGIRGI